MGIEQSGAVNEKLDRLVGGQRSERHDRLVHDAQPLSARRQDPDPRAGRQEALDEPGHLRDADLGAVKHDQPGTVGQGADDAVLGADRPG